MDEVDDATGVDPISVVGPAPLAIGDASNEPVFSGLLFTNDRWMNEAIDECDGSKLSAEPGSSKECPLP